ncbi:MAG TPA: UDP-N-acetylglucosamine 2-epimerase (non-hydrolyzing) [Pyrinomonadaceae bacterium]|nr:UDP-N-acetylglucosamine 2-epimerase (non-hydrolyzing) [Pyrinomonadaceae bacterium]
MSTSISNTNRPGWFDMSKTANRAGGIALKVMTIFGTRPEAIKLAPVIRELEMAAKQVRTVNVTSAQHTDLLYPFIRLFDIRIDHDLRAMRPNQTPNQLCSRVLNALDSVLRQERPDIILVQGDTTTAMAGALAGFHSKVPVAHVEAGLRSHNVQSPYPEEMNRRMITSLATYHFAATASNRATLLDEGIADENIFVTGNPVVDSLKTILKLSPVTPALEALLSLTNGQRRIILTTHRRESFGATMDDNLRAIRSFVESRKDVALIFPVHPNPSVASAARKVLSDHPRIHLIQPLAYNDFLVLMTRAWLIVSDSGGLQEECPTLGKPLLVLRENTERPEAIESGIARLVGGNPERLAAMLEEAYSDGSWANEVKEIENPFGAGDSGKQIAEIICDLLNAPARALKVG